jgi:hypothetical protein
LNQLKVADVRSRSEKLITEVRDSLGIQRRGTFAIGSHYQAAARED